MAAREEPDAAQLFEDLTFDELAEQAAQALHNQTGEVLSDAALDEVRTRAREIVSGTSAETPRGALPGALEGMQDMHNLTLAIGLPVPRILFAQMVEAAAASAGRKKVWLRQLKDMSAVRETGCIQVDFYDVQAGKKNTAYLVLEECDENHDFGAQLDKVYSRIAEDKQDEIRKHLSMLVYLGRSAYGQMLVKNGPTLAKITQHLPPGDDGKPFDPRVIGVDPANTTLYISLPKTKRVGIFVRFASATS